MYIIMRKEQKPARTRCMSNVGRTAILQWTAAIGNNSFESSSYQCLAVFVSWTERLNRPKHSGQVGNSDCAELKAI